MQDLTLLTAEELYGILKAGTKLYSEDELTAVRDELSQRKIIATPPSLEGGVIFGGDEPEPSDVSGTSEIRIAWALLVLGIVLFALATMSADIGYRLATTGMQSDSAQVINFVLIGVYVVGIITVIAHSLDREVKYKALWIIGGVLLTKWALFGLFIRSMIVPTEKISRSTRARTDPDTVYKD